MHLKSFSFQDINLTTSLVRRQIYPWTLFLQLFLRDYDYQIEREIDPTSKTQLEKNRGYIQH